MLNLDLYSFGFRSRGIPANNWGDGGGFVFDCRFLPNPYHIPELKHLTGRDQQIIDFFHEHPEVDIFVQQCLAIVETAAGRYQQRDFKHMQISFGCTGGQHRSVYCSEKMRELLIDKGYQVVLQHTEL